MGNLCCLTPKWGMALWVPYGVTPNRGLTLPVPHGAPSPTGGGGPTGTLCCVTPNRGVALRVLPDV